MHEAAERAAVNRPCRDGRWRGHAVGNPTASQPHQRMRVATYLCSLYRVLPSRMPYNMARCELVRECAQVKSARTPVPGNGTFTIRWVAVVGLQPGRVQQRDGLPSLPFPARSSRDLSTTAITCWCNNWTSHLTIAVRNNHQMPLTATQLFPLQHSVSVLHPPCPIYLSLSLRGSFKVTARNMHRRKENVEESTS